MAGRDAPGRDEWRGDLLPAFERHSGGARHEERHSGGARPFHPGAAAHGRSLAHAAAQQAQRSLHNDAGLRATSCRRDGAATTA